LLRRAHAYAHQGRSVCGRDVHRYVFEAMTVETGGTSAARPRHMA
jgi:hypothetical protein